MASPRFLTDLQFAKLNLSISVDLKQKQLETFKLVLLLIYFKECEEFLKEVNGPCCVTFEFSVECRSIR